MAKRMTESRKRKAMSHNRKIHHKDKDVRAYFISFYDRGTHFERVREDRTSEPCDRHTKDAIMSYDLESSPTSHE